MQRYETTYHFTAGGFSAVDVECAVDVKASGEGIHFGTVYLFVYNYDDKKADFYRCDDDFLARRIQDHILNTPEEYSKALAKSQEGEEATPEEDQFKALFVDNFSDVFGVGTGSASL